MLAFAVGFAIAITIDNQILLLFDTISACMLGLAAFLQSYRYREFYIVRIVSVAMSIVLWSVVFDIRVFSMIAIGMILLYTMYLFVDIISYIYWLKTSVPFDNYAIEEVDEESTKKIVQQKVQEYKKMIESVKEGKIDDKGINA